MLVATFTLLLLAFNQWYSCTFPIRYRVAVTTGKVFGGILFCWLIPIPALFTRSSIIPGEGFQSPDCENDEFMMSHSFRSVIAILFFTPGILMIFMYGHILVIVGRHERMDQNVRKLLLDLSTRRVVLADQKSAYISMLTQAK